MAKTYMKLDGNLVPVSLDTTISKEEQTKTVTDPNFSSGNVVVTPDAGKVLTEVTVVKDNDLVPENIVKDVDIFGVVGTAETGATGGYTVTFLFFNMPWYPWTRIKQANGNDFELRGIYSDLHYTPVVFENVTYIKVESDGGFELYHGITKAEALAGKTLTNDITLETYD